MDPYDVAIFVRGDAKAVTEVYPHIPPASTSRPFISSHTLEEAVQCQLFLACVPCLESQSAHIGISPSQIGVNGVAVPAHGKNHVVGHLQCHGKFAVIVSFDKLVVQWREHAYARGDVE